MDEQRSERIFGGLCVMLVLEMACVGLIAHHEHQRATLAEDGWAKWIHSGMERQKALDRKISQTADLLAEVDKLNQRVGELECENCELRQRLTGAGE